MLGALVEKASNMKEQVANVNREMEIPRKNPKEILNIKNTITEIKDNFMASLVVQTWLRKESLNWRI